MAEAGKSVWTRACMICIIDGFVVIVVVVAADDDDDVVVVIILTKYPLISSALAGSHLQ